MCARQLAHLFATLLIVLASVTLAACAPISNGPGRWTQDSNALHASTLSSKSIVGPRELTSAPARSLYDALRRVRPEFLWRRNPSPLNPGGYYAGVIVDGTPMGDVLSLHTFPATHVRQVRYVTAREAQLRYGPGYEGGAVLVAVGR